VSTVASFVLFPLAERRFALPAEQVAELALPGRLQTFPHTTPELSGVLLRRGRIVPVCDIAPRLIGPKAPAGRFYLMAHVEPRRDEWTAIPVTGECELAACEMARPTTGSPAYVVGTLTRGEEQVPVIDLHKLLSQEVH
jgi:chemotaxis signal transduction protein